jgi:hypothetical protein
MFLPESTAQRLRCQHGSIAILIEAQGEQQLRRRPSPEKWSIVEHIAHLSAYQQVFGQRIKRILMEENPLIARYEGDHDPYFLEVREQPLDDLLVDLSVDRQYLYEWLHSLSSGQLGRKATHPVYGSRSLLMWTEFFLLHEAHHCNTIWKLTEDNS